MQPTIATLIDDLWGVSVESWVKVLILIAILLLVSTIIRKIMRINQIVLTIALFLVSGIIGAKWVQDRNEPHFMTPVVNVMASIFGQGGRPAAQINSLPEPAAPPVTTPTPTEPATTPTRTTPPPPAPIGPPIIEFRVNYQNPQPQPTTSGTQTPSPKR